jgi:hypothetical protein
MGFVQQGALTPPQRSNHMFFATILHGESDAIHIDEKILKSNKSVINQHSSCLPFHDQCKCFACPLLVRFYIVKKKGKRYILVKCSSL